MGCAGAVGEHRGCGSTVLRASALPVGHASLLGGRAVAQRALQHAKLKLSSC